MISFNSMNETCNIDDCVNEAFYMHNIHGSESFKLIENVNLSTE